MEPVPYILNAPLSVEQDFKYLNNYGIELIESLSGNDWTNFNPVDPGITILEQLCYALTELGYCNSFPLKDILTDSSNKLTVEDQFILPHKLLTTSAVTTSDYILLILDQFVNVVNASINPIFQNTGFSPIVYQTCLQTTALTEKYIPDEIAQRVYYLLNRSRNLGNLFLTPVVLQPDVYTIQGTIEISPSIKLSTFYADLQSTLLNIIFPSVMPQGFADLFDEVKDINQVYNGPLLANGLLDKNKLKNIKTNLSLFEVASRIQSIQEVLNVSLTSFKDSNQHSVKSIDCPFPNVMVLDLKTSILNGELVIKSNGIPCLVMPNDFTVDIPNKWQNTLNSKIISHPEVPTGTFREINTYHTIQNTFPDIYAVGINATNSNASPYQIAQSKQLKGYLTLFDQVLANQFSQLANIDKLFSFKNTSSPDIKDEIDYYSKKPGHLYPVPYRTFCTTYFFQTLYNIPNIRPLLKDSSAFKFSEGTFTKQEIEKLSWEEYINDPYNGYVSCLMECIENNENAVNRRDNLLNHLLARHGFSLDFINNIIPDSSYVKIPEINKVITKSLLLQNYELLGYNRAKAYNFLAADKIITVDDNVNVNKIYDKYGNNTEDFMVSFHKIDKNQKLIPHDFTNYSGLELFLNLIFGLNTTYQQQINFFKDLNDPITYTSKINELWWFVTQRKGLILFEPQLLFLDADFEVYFKLENSVYYTLESPIDYAGSLELKSWCMTASDDSLTASLKTGALTFGIYSYNVREIAFTNCPEDYFESCSGSRVSMAVKAFWDLNTFINITDPAFNQKLVLIFPDYCEEVNKPYFRSKLEACFDELIPIQLSTSVILENHEKLSTKVIPSFINWHNSLRFNDSDLKLLSVKTGAASLVNYLSGNS